MVGDSNAVVASVWASEPIGIDVPFGKEKGGQNACEYILLHLVSANKHLICNAQDR